MYRTNRKPRSVQAAVAQAIQGGLVVSTVKQKALTQGGLQTVTIGPRVAAVPDGYLYQVVYWRKRTGSQDDPYRTAWDAARDFIEFVGRDLAWAAVKAAKAAQQSRDALGAGSGGTTASGDNHSGGHWINSQ